MKLIDFLMIVLAVFIAVEMIVFVTVMLWPIRKGAERICWLKRNVPRLTVAPLAGTVNARPASFRHHQFRSVLEPTKRKAYQPAVNWTILPESAARVNGGRPNSI